MHERLQAGVLLNVLEGFVTPIVLSLNGASNGPMSCDS